jgi:uncharacterized membrane protein YkvA (DUF1232 family)
VIARDTAKGLRAHIYRWKNWARAIGCDVIALWLASRDPRVRWLAKALAAVVAAYALSPIDLIPDFIPVLGLLDDLILVPIGIWIAVRLIPGPVMAEFRIKAGGLIRPISKWGMVVVALTWIAGLALIWGFVRTKG